MHEDQWAVVEELSEQAARKREGIYERVNGDFAAGLLEAERVMQRYLRIKANQDATREAWDKAIERRRRQLERMERLREKACAKYDHDLQRCLLLLDGFMMAFAEHLPRNAKSFSTPVGTFRRRACRPKTVKEPDRDVVEVLKRLPLEAMQAAIELKPAVNWSWVKHHLVDTDEGPVLRHVDPDTGEIMDVPAVVEREGVDGDVIRTPIMRVVEPPQPYTITIVPADQAEQEEADNE